MFLDLHYLPFVYTLWIIVFLFAKCSFAYSIFHHYRRVSPFPNCEKHQTYATSLMLFTIWASFSIISSNNFIVRGVFLSRFYWNTFPKFECLHSRNYNGRIPCRHAVMCWHCTSTGPILIASVHYRHDSGNFTVKSTFSSKYFTATFKYVFSELRVHNTLLA